MRQGSRGHRRAAHDLEHGLKRGDRQVRCGPRAPRLLDPPDGGTSPAGGGDGVRRKSRARRPGVRPARRRRARGHAGARAVGGLRRRRAPRDRLDVRRRGGRQPARDRPQAVGRRLHSGAGARQRQRHCARGLCSRPAPTGQIFAAWTEPAGGERGRVWASALDAAGVPVGPVAITARDRGCVGAVDRRRRRRSPGDRLDERPRRATARCSWCTLRCRARWLVSLVSGELPNAGQPDVAFDAAGNLHVAFTAFNNEARGTHQRRLRNPAGDLRRATRRRARGRQLDRSVDRPGRRRRPRDRVDRDGRRQRHRPGRHRADAGRRGVDRCRARRGRGVGSAPGGGSDVGHADARLGPRDRRGDGGAGRQSPAERHDRGARRGVRDRRRDLARSRLLGGGRRRDRLAAQPRWGRRAGDIRAALYDKTREQPPPPPPVTATATAASRDAPPPAAATVRPALTLTSFAVAPPCIRYGAPFTGTRKRLSFSFVLSESRDGAPRDPAAAELGRAARVPGRPRARCGGRARAAGRSWTSRLPAVPVRRPSATRARRSARAPPRRGRCGKLTVTRRLKAGRRRVVLRQAPTTFVPGTYVVTATATAPDGRRSSSPRVKFWVLRGAG